MPESESLSADTDDTPFLSSDELSTEELAVHMRTLSVSLRASRAELRATIAVKERAEERTVSQHKQIEDLQSKLSVARENLDTVSGSARELSERIAEREERLHNAEAEVLRLSDTLHSTQNELSTALAALQVCMCDGNEATIPNLRKPTYTGRKGCE
jgi:chromosome segregation ATPase